MSTLTPRRLRRIALVSLLIGVGIVAIGLLGGWATTFIHEWNDADAGLGFLIFIALVVGCGGIVFAGNALAWSAIVPGLPHAESKRAYVVAAITFGFVVVSPIATFFLVLGSFYLQP